tara:strand:- start:2036 stop:2548 length:513 start_codon:yes stop_codon:yes gene_type:complete
MIEVLEFNKNRYPKFQGEGNAAQFAIPFAQHVCKGAGYDIGCKKIEWAFPGSTPIDIDFDDEWHALNLPEKKVDYIFSSHCLEHVEVRNWVEVLDYWSTKLNPSGVIFLYLPDYSQEYWRPWNNKKHRHILQPQYLKDYFTAMKYYNIFVSGIDLNNAFMAMAQFNHKLI